MKVLLVKDVYKLGRAGDVKKVANGYGRNYLIPQGLVVLATPGALKQADRIRSEADVQRTALNQELGGVAQQLDGLQFVFPVRASETGKLYGSVSTRQIAQLVTEKAGVEISHRQIESQPIRLLGAYTIPIRLTMDLAPVINIIVHREGEPPESVFEEEVQEAEAVAPEEPEVVEAEEEPVPEAEAETSEPEAGEVTAVEDE